jgi:pimeloyl-ACP methyl ester carboxylesterase
VNAQCDVRFIQDLVHQIANGIAGAQLLELPDSGHLPAVEHPDVITTALMTFLGADIA